MLVKVRVKEPQEPYLIVARRQIVVEILALCYHNFILPFPQMGHSFYRSDASITQN